MNEISIADVYAMCGNQKKSQESRNVIEAYQTRIQADINKAVVNPNHALLLAVGSVFACNLSIS